MNSYRLEVPLGDRTLARVISPRWHDAPQPSLVLPEQESFDLKLLDSASGRPLPGGLVTIPGKALSMGYEILANRLRASQEGTVMLSLLPGEIDGLHFEGYEATEVVTEGRTITARLRPAGAPAKPAPILAVEARIADQDGEPIAGAALWAVENPGCVGLSDPSGRVVVKVPEGYLGPFAAGAVDAAMVGDLFLGPPDVVTVELPRHAGAVAGILSGPEGRPVEGAEARLLGSWRAAYSDRSGRFIARGIPVYRHWSLRASAPEFLDLQARVSSADEGKDGLVFRELKLLRPVDVRARVVDSRGQPLSGLVVRLGDSGAAPASTDPRGVFSLRGIRPGEIFLTVEEEDRVVGLFQSSIPATQAEFDLGDLAIAPTGRIWGFVEDQDGGPVERARVYLESGRERPMELPVPGQAGESMVPLVRTDATGFFELQGLPLDAPVQVGFARTGYSATMLKIDAISDEPLSVLLPRLAELHLEVLSESTGEPLPLATVRHGFGSSRPSGEQPIWTGPSTYWTDGDGRVTITGLPEASYELDLMADGYAPARLELDFPESQRHLTVELQQEAVLFGYVFDETGDPIEGASIGRIAGSSGVLHPGDLPVTSDGEGRYRLSGRKPGTLLEITLRHPEMQVTRRSVQVPKGETRIDFHLKRLRLFPLAGTVEIRGLDLPERMAIVANQLESGEENLAQVDPSGAFRFDGLPQGDYRLSFRSPVDLPPLQPVTGLRLRLDREVRDWQIVFVAEEPGSVYRE